MSLRLHSDCRKQKKYCVVYIRLNTVVKIHSFLEEQLYKNTSLKFGEK